MSDLSTIKRKGGEARLQKGEVIAARQMRLRLQAFARLSSRYIDQLDALMSDPDPVIRCRALEHFRKTVGLERSGGFQVSVNAAAAITRDGPGSFEQMLDAVKGKIAQEAAVGKNFSS